jgi:hypothetical protein
MKITREQAEDMSQAHAEGYHDELPREGCPDCEDRDLREYSWSKHEEEAKLSAEGKDCYGSLE